MEFVQWTLCCTLSYFQVYANIEAEKPKKHDWWKSVFMIKKQKQIITICVFMSDTMYFQTFCVRTIGA